MKVPKRSKAGSGKAPSAQAPSAKAKAKPRPEPFGDWRALLAACLLLTILGASVAAWTFQRGYTLYYGDAEAHLNNARRVIDTRTPNLEQFGTVWLPLPHLAMIPFVRNDAWWKSGLAGAIPSVAAFVVAGMFLFAAVRRALSSDAAAWTALAVFALNPNLLYLQSTPMTEPLMFAAMMALLWATLVFRDTQSWWAVIAAGAASNAASLTRYEGWFVIPFVAAYLWICARDSGTNERAWAFLALASLGPLAWLIHNQVYWGDALEFYRGQWSAKAIYARQLAAGLAPYPGDHDWPQAVRYYFEAIRATCGLAVLAVAALGAIAALIKRSWWPVLFLSLAPLFYVVSMHGGGTPIYLPSLPPFSWYNTRYGLAALPLAAFAAGALMVRFRSRIGMIFALGVGVAVSAVPYVSSPLPSICWKESEVNSVERRQWQSEVARYLASEYKPGSGVFASLGTLAGVFREAGVPMREVLHEGNHPDWDRAVASPSTLKEEWAIAIPGDPVDTTIERAPYTLVHSVSVGSTRVRLYRLKH